MSVRLQTTVNDNDYQKLVALVQKSGDDINTVVRKALGLYVWANMKLDEGLVIGSIDKDKGVVVTIVDVTG